MSLIDDFKEKFPEFEQKDLDKISIYEDLISCYLSIDYDKSSDCNKKLALYFIAHMVQDSNNKSSSSSTPLGLVSNHRVRDVSVSYNTDISGLQYDDVFFSTTTYGQIYLLLLRKRTSGVFIVV